MFSPFFFFLYKKIISLRKVECHFRYKAGVSLPDFKEFDGIGVDGHNRMQFMFAQIPSDFLFPLPDRSDTIFVIFIP